MINKVMAEGEDDSIVLDEELDPNYEPTEQEVSEYATWLGMDPIKDNALYWIAREGLKAPLPPQWKPCRTKDTDEIYYFNFESGASTWDHPCDEYYKKLFENTKRNQSVRDQNKEIRHTLSRQSSVASLLHSEPKPKEFILKADEIQDVFPQDIKTFTHACKNPLLVANSVSAIDNGLPKLKPLLNRSVSLISLPPTLIPRSSNPFDLRRSLSQIDTPLKEYEAPEDSISPKSSHNFSNLKACAEELRACYKDHKAVLGKIISKDLSSLFKGIFSEITKLIKIREPLWAEPKPIKACKATSASETEFAISSTACTDLSGRVSPRSKLVTSSVGTQIGLDFNLEEPKVLMKPVGIQTSPRNANADQTNYSVSHVCEKLIEKTSSKDYQHLEKLDTKLNSYIMKLRTMETKFDILRKRQLHTSKWRDNSLLQDISEITCKESKKLFEQQVAPVLADVQKIIAMLTTWDMQKVDRNESKVITAIDKMDHMSDQLSSFVAKFSKYDASIRNNETVESSKVQKILTEDELYHSRHCLSAINRKRILAYTTTYKASLINESSNQRYSNVQWIFDFKESISKSRDELTLIKNLHHERRRLRKGNKSN